MSVLFYVFALIVISLVVALGGILCESSRVSSILGGVKKCALAASKVVIFALMLPAFVVFRAAGAIGNSLK
jgi:hypothetical protein